LIAYLRRFPLRSFPEALEPDFQAYYIERSLPFVRVAGLLAAALYIAFLFWDLVLDSDVLAFSLVIRTAVAMFVVVLLACTFLPWFKERIQLTVGTAAVVSGIGVVSIIAHIGNGLMIGLAGVMLVLMFNFGFVRLLFWPSILCALLIIGAYDIAAVLSPLETSLIVANNFFLISAIIAGGAITFLFEKLFRLQYLADRDLASERQRGDLLIQNMLPRHIAARLKAGERMIAESHPEATVIFADLVGFTNLTKTLAPPQMLGLLNDIFSIMDGLVEKHGLDKIKTMGDSYMAVGGIAEPDRDSSADAVAEFALDMMEEVSTYGRRRSYPLTLRVGIHTGEVIGGVIGFKKFSYDLWGETVNLASRLEAQSEPGYIQVSESTYRRLCAGYRLQPRGAINVRGIGEISTYFLLGRALSIAGTCPPRAAS
jgi:adenylate cyclase